MKTFGGFRSGDEFFYGELRGNEVHRLSGGMDSVQPDERNTAARESASRCSSRAIEIDRSRIELRDYIAVVTQTRLQIGAPSIRFKAPSSLLAHHGATK